MYMLEILIDHPHLLCLNFAGTFENLIQNQLLESLTKVNWASINLCA